MPPFGFDQDPPAADGDFGFPDGIRQAFLRTADEMNCVVMSRVPGRAATTLINERYDLKGYFVKAKSCDWGPMAGFICSTPEFSKIETTQAKIRGQRDALRAYLKVIWSMGHPQPGRPVPEVHPPGDPAPNDLLPLRRLAFIPIWISNARKAELEARREYIDDRVYDPATGVGIAYNAARTVVMPFCFRRPASAPNCWALFHGGAYMRDGATWREQAADPLITPGLTGDPIPAANLAPFEASFHALGSVFADAWPFPRAGNIAMRPVFACQNPFPAYRVGPNDYKNAFAGDYDLFAVWPATRRLDMQRVSERDWLPEQNEVRPNTRQWGLMPHMPIFLPVADRVFTVESMRVRGLYLEFIPTQGEMDSGLEDQQLGNINQVIADTCVKLNSFAAAGYGDGEPPNVAFHSDEGGRHSITEIEWPIAVFLPRELARDFGADAHRAFCFPKRPESRQNFVRFIAALAGYCEVPIASGWLWDLMTDPNDRTQASAIGLSIAHLLMTGRYVDNPLRANAQPIAEEIIARLAVPYVPPTTVPPAPNTANFTYARVDHMLQITVPAAAAGV